VVAKAERADPADTGGKAAQQERVVRGVTVPRAQGLPATEGMEVLVVKGAVGVTAGTAAREEPEEKGALLISK